ncbi:hypothetical protein U0070_021891, partial [Myodes glareolus]
MKNAVNPLDENSAGLGQLWGGLARDPLAPSRAWVALLPSEERETISLTVLSSVGRQLPSDRVSLCGLFTILMSHPEYLGCTHVLLYPAPTSDLYNPAILPSIRCHSFLRTSDCCVFSSLTTKPSVTSLHAQLLPKRDSFSFNAHSWHLLSYW